MTLGRRRDKEPSSDGCSEFVRTPGTGAAGDGNASERHALHTRAREPSKQRYAPSIRSFVPEIRDGGGSRMNVDTLERHVRFFIIRVFDRRRTQNEQGIEYI